MLRMKKIVLVIVLLTTCFYGFGVNLSGTISSNVTYEKEHLEDAEIDVVVTGNLTINENCTLKLDGTLTINSGCTLTINGSVTAKNIINNGTIELNSAVLYATNDITLNANSVLKYNTGLSYVAAGNNITQNANRETKPHGDIEIKDPAKIKVEPSKPAGHGPNPQPEQPGASGILLALNTYYDNTNLYDVGPEKPHPWYVKEEPGGGKNKTFSFDEADHFFIGVNSYVYDGKEFNKKGNPHQDALDKLLEDMKDNGVNEEEIQEQKEIISELLPIELTYFTVSQKGKEVVFEWETATETNNDYFTIEYSFDGNIFSEIAEISGAGTTSEATTYVYEWNANEKGLLYMRLKQTDYNGEYSYSKVIPFSITANEMPDVYYQIGKGIMYKGSLLRF